MHCTVGPASRAWPHSEALNLCPEEIRVFRNRLPESASWARARKRGTVLSGPKRSPF